MKFFYPLFLMCFTLFFAVLAPADELLPINKKSPEMVLQEAVICEGLSNLKPVRPAVVFSISQGNLFCFTSFDPVYAKTPVYHHWYNRDRLVFSMRLILSVPKWSCFSKIQIRDADKGPWRVEVLDEDMRVIKILRFSMVD